MPTTQWSTFGKIQGWTERTVVRSDTGDSELLTKGGGGVGAVIDTLKSTVRTPDFRRLKRLGTLPNNPMEYLRKTNGSIGVIGRSTSESHTSSDGGFYRDTYQFYSWDCSAFGQYPDYGNLQNRFALDVKMITKMKGEQWNAPVFVAEAGKTADMVLVAASKLHKSYRALRKGNFNEFFTVLGAEPPKSQRARRRFNTKYGKDPVNTAASTMLEYSWGWVPLLSDVESAAKLLAQTVVDLRNTGMSVRGRTIQVDKSTGDDSAPIGPVIVKYIWEQTRTSTLRGTYSFIPKPGTLPAALGLANPAVVLWELIPLSCVADWFLPVSDYLETLDAYHYSDFKSYTVGVKTENVRTYSSPSNLFPKFETSVIHVRAIPQGGPPNPSFTDAKFKFDLDLRKMALAASLLAIFRK